MHANALVTEFDGKSDCRRSVEWATLAATAFLAVQLGLALSAFPTQSSYGQTDGGSLSTEDPKRERAIQEDLSREQEIDPRKEFAPQKRPSRVEPSVTTPATPDSVFSEDPSRAAPVQRAVPDPTQKREAPPSSQQADPKASQSPADSQLPAGASESGGMRGTWQTSIIDWLQQNPLSIIGVVTVLAVLAALLLALRVVRRRLAGVSRRWRPFKKLDEYESKFSAKREPNRIWLALQLLRSKFLVPASDRHPTNDDKPTPEGLPEKQVTIADRLVSDRPLQPGDPDPLGVGGIARGISGFLRNEKTEPPLTLAVLGEWGTGKSSIMNLLKGDLETFGYRPVWFNAWHHQQEEHLLAALLETLRTGGFPPWTSAEGIAFRWRLFRIRIRRNPWPLILFFGLLAVQFVLIFVLPDFNLARLVGFGEGDSSAAKPATLPGFAAILVLVYTFFTRWRNALLDPAKLAAALGNRLFVQRFRDKLSFRHRFAEEFSDVAAALDPMKIVILIDDLDRCQPGNVMEVLETVNFLVSSGSCYVVMGIDKDRVVGCVAHSFREVAADLALAAGTGSTPKKTSPLDVRMDFARQYMDKLINIEVPVPPLRPDDARKLLLSAADGQGKAATTVSVPPHGGHKVALWTGIICGGIVAAGLAFSVGLQVPDPGNAAGAGGLGAQTSGGATTGPATSAGFVSWLFAVLAAAFSFAIVGWYTASTYQERLRSLGAIIDDSKDFKDALEIWYPLIARTFRTPRALKRFLNRMRYLAMCTRPETDDGSKPGMDSINPDVLVALATASESGESLESLQNRIPKQASSGEPVATHADGDADLGYIIAEHQRRFGDWPPNVDAIARFQTVVAGVRVN